MASSHIRKKLVIQFYLVITAAQYSEADNRPIPPVCPVPINIFVDDESKAAVVTWETPTCYDEKDKHFISDCNPPSGEMFTPGVHIVTCTCMDSDGWQSFCTFLVSVQENHPPNSPSCPDNISIGVGKGENGTLIPWKYPTCSDEEDGSLPVFCSHEPNTSFPLQTTTINCTCTDSFGVSAYCAFSVEVHDVTPPTIIINPQTTQLSSLPILPTSGRPQLKCPENIVVISGDSITASDDVSWMPPYCSETKEGAVLSKCKVAPTLKRGENKVICGCSESSNQSRSCSFTISLIRASPKPEDIATEIASGVIGVLGTLCFLILSICIIRCHLTRTNRSVSYDATPMSTVSSLSRKRFSSSNVSTSLIGRETKLVSYLKDSIHLQKTVGRGSRSITYRGTIIDDIPVATNRKVAVKVLADNIPDTMKSAFKKELSIYESIGEHQNIAMVFGYCIDSNPFYLVMEYLPNGNLQQYLQFLLSQKDSPYMEENFNLVTSETISQFDLLSFGSQIAEGIEYIHSCDIIHRNISAKHVLLGNDRVCKVSGFRYATEANAVTGSEIVIDDLSVRWMSPETILQNKFNTFTDVWSFGVVLWEIITFGCHPYLIMSDEEVKDAVPGGYRLPRPDHCLQKFYSLMMQCWSTNPEVRPPMTKIITEIDLMLEDDQGYLLLELFQRNNNAVIMADDM